MPGQAGPAASDSLSARFSGGTRRLLSLTVGAAATAATAVRAGGTVPADVRRHCQQCLDLLVKPGPGWAGTAGPVTAAAAGARSPGPGPVTHVRARAGHSLLPGHGSVPGPAQASERGRSPPKSLDLLGKLGPASGARGPEARVTPLRAGHRDSRSQRGDVQVRGPHCPKRL